MERAAETADALAAAHGLRVTTDDRLIELDFGEWTGWTLDALQPLEDWRHFNTFRSGTRPPGGELMLEAQARVVSMLLALREAHAGQVVVAVTHGDVIKAALAFFLGVPLDLAHRMEIDPASRSIVEAHAWGARVLALNTPHGSPWIS
jgi:probable phosphoglycerate mutase